MTDIVSGPGGLVRAAPPNKLAQVPGAELLPPDHITIRIQPDEGIALSFQAKQPGAGIELQEVEMDFAYGQSFKTKPAEACERLLHDAMLGNHTLFTREDGVERSWQIVEPVLEDPPAPSTSTRRGAGGRNRPRADRAPPLAPGEPLVALPPGEHPARGDR